MGEIIIKVPENVKEVIDLEIPYKEVKENIKKLKRVKLAKKALEIVEKYKGTIKVKDVKEEELYLQGD
jgi:activator of HSP90 ATPase